MSDAWGEINIGKSAYLRGRIGWQGLRADEFIEEGPYLVTGTDFEDGGVNWSTCYHVSEARFQEGAYIHLRDGDLLITKDGTIGKVAYVRNCPEKAVLNSGVFLLRAKDSAFNHRFLYHVLQSHLFSDFIRQNLAGSTINHLYQHVFERFSFLAPNDDEQARIADVLDSIDAAMRAVQALITKQARIRAGLLQDLFTRGVDQNGALRPPREEAPDLYHQTELGWLPNGWDAPTIKELVDPLRPVVYGILMPGYGHPDGVPVVKVKDIRNGRIDVPALLLTSPKIDAEYARSRLKPGDLLITIRGTVGRLAIVPQILNGANITQDTARLAIASGDPFFYRYYLETHAAKTFLEANTLGNAVQGINLGDVRRMRAPKPPQFEQSEIARRVIMFDEHLHGLQTEANKLGALKSALMQDLLTGRVSVAPLLQAQAA